MKKQKFNYLILIGTICSILLGIALILGLKKMIIDFFYGDKKIPIEYIKYSYYYYDEQKLMSKKILMIYLSLNSILVYLIFFMGKEKSNQLFGWILLLVSIIFLLQHFANFNAGMLW